MTKGGVQPLETHKFLLVNSVLNMLTIGRGNYGALKDRLMDILKDIMRDPHVAADGFTYEAEEFRKWISRECYTSPMTNLVLANPDLVPNHALRSTIQDWLQKHPKFLGSSQM